MGFSRAILGGALALSLAACAPVSVVTPAGTPALKIASVSVDTSGMTKTIEGRAYEISNEQLAADLKTAIEGALAPSSDPDGTPVDVSVRMTEVRLAPPAERIVAGTSWAKGVLKVTEVKGRRVVVPPTAITGNSKNIRMVGLIGLVTTVSADKDYQGTVAGFADTLQKALFGSEK